LIFILFRYQLSGPQELSLRRNRFVGIASGSKERHFKKIGTLYLLKYHYRQQSLHKGHQPVACRSKAKAFKTLEAVFETSG
jgi:hypothetical protein